MDSDSSEDQKPAFHHGSRLEANDPAMDQNASRAEHKAQTPDDDDADNTSITVFEQADPKNEPVAATDATSATSEFDCAEDEEKPASSPALTHPTAPFFVVPEDMSKLSPAEFAWMQREVAHEENKLRSKRRTRSGNAANATPKTTRTTLYDRTTSATTGAVTSISPRVSPRSDRPARNDYHSRPIVTSIESCTITPSCRESSSSIIMLITARITTPCTWKP